LPRLVPVLLGQGKRLFPDGEQKLRLKLAEAKTVGEGISLLRYTASAR
jgi:dihydrofolate reductase